MVHQRKKYGEIVKKIIDVFADLLIATKISYLPSPYYTLGKFIKALLEEDKSLNKKQIKKALYDLEKRKLIDIIEKDGQVKIYLQEKGKQKVITRSIKLLLDYKKKEKKWDGRWFMVFFDVPEIERRKRNFLRRYLKRLGFYQYQQSVYIFPFECKKEVNLIKEIVEGAKYMKYIIASEIEEEEKIKKYFGL
jgi:CRISPR-associated endonuclease Cas2